MIIFYYQYLYKNAKCFNKAFKSILANIFFKSWKKCVDLKGSHIEKYTFLSINRVHRDL